MADRSVVVRYRADTSDLTAKSAAAGASIKGAFSGAQSSGQALQQTTHNLGLGFLAIGGLAAAGVSQAIGAYAGFDQQMSAVEAATHETAAGMGVLRDATLEAGAASQFSATQAGQGVEELAKAGVATADIVGGALKGSLDLAAAGGLAVAESATTMATALSVFNLEGADAAHVADLLAAGAGKAQGSVSDMAAALNQSALVANQVGLSVEDTTGVLAEFANAGLLGSDAGTSFRTMLLRLINPSVEARDVMADLGINVYDASGQFVGMESVAAQLQDRMGGLDEETRNAALATIFGADAIRGASVLYNDGADGVAKWRDNVTDAGYAAETARIMTDNLRGDVERMGGAFETAMIKIGEGADGPLRSATQWLTNVFSAVADAGPGVQQSILVIGGLTAAIGLAGGAAFLAAPKIVAFNTAVKAMRAEESATSTRALGAAMSGIVRWLPVVGGLLAVGSIVLGSYAQKTAEAKAAADAFAESLDDVTGALTEQSTKPIADELQDAVAGYDELGLSLAEVTRIVAEGGPEYDELELRLLQTSETFAENSREANILREAMVAQRAVVEEGNAAFEEETAAQKAAAAAAGDHADAADGVTGALGRTEQAATDVNEAVSTFEDSLNRLFDISWGVSEAEDALSTMIHQLEDEIRGAADSGEDFARSLDGTSQAAIDNRETLRDMARGLADVAQQGIEAGDTEAEVSARYLEGRDALIEKLVALGYNEEAVRTLIDTEGDIQPLIDTYFATTGLSEATERVNIHDDAIRGVPLDWNTVFNADTADAEAKVRTFDELADAAAEDRYTTIFVDDDWSQVHLPAGVDKAEGGYVPPREGGTFARLAEAGEGEWVVPESKVTDFIAGMVGGGGWGGGRIDTAVVEAAAQPATYAPATGGGGDAMWSRLEALLGGQSGAPLIGNVTVHQQPGEPDSRTAKTISDMAAALIGMQG